MMILAPSMLSADFKNLGKEIRTIEENGAQYLHLFARPRIWSVMRTL